MRGREKKQTSLFTSASVESLVEKKLPADHPLRRVKANADLVLASLSAEFDQLYPERGRASVPPEQLLRALLWQALFSVRSERLLEDCLRYDLRCRWFVNLPLEVDAWDHSVFSKTRESARLQTIAGLFFDRHLEFLRAEGLLSSEHLSVDGTLMAAWASHKSLVRRDEIDKDGKPPPPPEGGRNGWVDFKGQERSNDTHVSATDPESRLASKGTGAKLCHELNVLAENRNNFAVAFEVKSPTGTSEREAARDLVSKEVQEGRRPGTVGADRKYAEGTMLVPEMVAMHVTPHFAVRDDRPNALARQYHTDGYDISRQKRMRIEEVFAYVKTIAGLAKLKVRGTLRVWGTAAVALSAYNLTHQASLTAA